VEAPLITRLEAPDGPVQVRVWPGERPEPTAPVLLACHGWTDSGEVFGPLAHALDRGWTVVAPDAPGHGGTPRRPGRFVVAEHAVSVLAVLDALPRVAGRRDQVVVLGHSMGALTATRVAAARPSIVARLVLEDPARATGAPPLSARAMRSGLLELRDLDHAGLVARARAEHPDWPEVELDPWARSKREMDPGTMDGGADWGSTLTALLPGVDAPVLIIHGEPRRGGIVSPTAAARCAAACSAPVTVLRLPVAHCPRREAPAAFVAALRHVLQTACRPGGHPPTDTDQTDSDQ
jgi:pimeloyl-ACP methyl ester carboxylesterase